MTLEYRCSNCGTLLQTTNADPLHDEIERLRSELASSRECCTKFEEAVDEDVGAILELRQELEMVRKGADKWIIENQSLRNQLVSAKGIIRAIFDPSGADDELRKAVEAFLAACANTDDLREK